MAKPLVTCLWFDGQAEAAANFYCSVFKDSKITQVTPMVVTFELNGNKFMGLNGGPKFKFDEAISIMVNCDNQDEIDYYWDALTKDGGEESVCGWLKDKFGLSWQIVPSNLGELMAEPERAKRVMEKVMKMVKLDIATLENA
ncbi:VOC family protein [Pedobacter zeae]|uniref:Putative 3-demethylubiquinone-9 3-methyltransferase (Glyoxalase superfamily) n=1 Tax=Pedobacter zeae TaxID=1737356 RepID=A0A7W6KA78_9SPHI|nr:VOC family protein [Pedobacter zeae]MBB4108060.1 putative 3-demethylubiquinone-9 3-methyltransferase (glyoxalase superfamily) [Pedobacter zeae]GGG95274.1 VOC family protein [Pedobacter zeae]